MKRIVQCAVLLSVLAVAFHPHTAMAKTLDRVWQAYANNDIQGAIRGYTEYLAGLTPDQRAKHRLNDWGLEWRLANPVIKPEYTQKILALIIQRTKGQADPRLLPGSHNLVVMDPGHIETIQRNCGLVARFVEAASRGKLSIVFEYKILDATVTHIVPYDKIENDKYIKIDPSSITPFPTDIVHQAYKTADAIFIYYPMPYQTYCFGGMWWGGFPVVPYTAWGPRRGRSEFNTRRGSGFMLTLHEYFHSLESHLGLKNQDEFVGDFSKIFNFYPEYPAARKIWNDQGRDYYDWQFSVNIPKILEESRKKGDARGWRRMAYHETYPYKITDTHLGRYKKLTANISPVKLLEAQTLRGKADESWKKGDKEEADRLMRRVMALNPGFADCFRHFAERHADAKRYPEALMQYEQYFQLVDDWWQYSRAARLAAEHLKDKKKAEHYFALSVKHANPADRSRAVFEWALAMKDVYQDWKRVLEITASLAAGNADRFSGESWYLRTEAAFHTKDAALLREGFRQVEQAGLFSNAWFARLASRLLWSLEPAGRWPEILLWGQFASRFQDARWANESRVLYGEALLIFGEQSRGEKMMQEAVAALNKNWATDRYGRRFLPKAGIAYRIRQRESGRYLVVRNGRLAAGSAKDREAVWLFQPLSGAHVRIHNQATGGYLHTQNQKGYIESSAPIQDGWWSAQWLVKIDQDRAVSFSNRWKPDMRIDVPESGPRKTASGWILEATVSANN